MLSQIELAEDYGRTGRHGDGRELLEALVDVVDSRSDVAVLRRCLKVADQIGDRDLAFHFAMCLWSARPGTVEGHRAVAGAAMFHPDRRVAGAGFRVSKNRARASDWGTIAAADRHANWPELSALCAGADGGAPTLAQLADDGRLRSIGSYGTGVWALTGARITRVGKSIAIGVESDSPGGWTWIPAFTVWDPSAALGWGARPHETDDVLGLLGTRFSYSGYWHWLFEGLLHAVRLDEAGLVQQLDRIAVCTNGRPSRTMSESLDAVGIPSGKVAARSTAFDLVVDEVVLPMRAPGFGGVVDESLPSSYRDVVALNAQHTHDADIAAVRRRLGVDGGARRSGRRLYVSRRDAAKRRVVNEDALVAALGDLGFEVVVPGTLTFAEQVATFSAAEIVVGPHGAGLANSLVMPQGGAMLELHHPDEVRPYYQRLATAIGLRYQDLRCGADPAAPPDMVVAVDDAIASVRTLLGPT